MSLILEALRKSEAERRRGLPPDLHAELPPVPVRRVPARALWWAAGAALLLACIVAWFALREPAQPTAAATQPASPSAASTVQPRPAPPPLPARTPSVARTPATAPTPAPAPEPITEPQGASDEAPPRAPAAAASASETPSADVATATPDATTRSVRPDAASAAASPDPPHTGSASASATSTSDGRVLSLAELDPGTRNALPPLKLSMHLWNREPAQRFVILDGQRLGEGDRIGEASIVRIERDGVLLDWHGRGIRVPVR